MNSPNSLPSVTPASDQPTPPLLAFASLIDQLEADAEARNAARINGSAFGAVTGFPALDLVLGGALEPGLHIVHGSPGVGKTAFALQVSSSCGCPALYITCEMTPLELLRRHTARITSTYLGKFKNGTLSGPEARSRATIAAKAAPFLALLDATEIPAAVCEVLHGAEVTRSKDPDAQHFLLVVDSLHSWADALGADVPEYDRLNAGLAALRLLSKRLDCAVVAIAERNRSSMKTGGQSAGAGTRKLEYGAETVIELDTKDEFDAADGTREITASISKNRSGASGGKIRLRFHGALQKYTEAVP